MIMSDTMHAAIEKLKNAVKDIDLTALELVVKIKRQTELIHRSGYYFAFHTGGSGLFPNPHSSWSSAGMIDDYQVQFRLEEKKIKGKEMYFAELDNIDNPCYKDITTRGNWKYVLHAAAYTAIVKMTGEYKQLSE